MKALEVTLGAVIATPRAVHPDISECEDSLGSVRTSSVGCREVPFLLRETRLS